jgi:hypothetical protein
MKRSLSRMNGDAGKKDANGKEMLLGGGGDDDDLIRWSKVSVRVSVHG